MASNTDFPSLRRSDIIDGMVDRLQADNLTHDQATTVVGTIIRSMTDALVEGQRIELRGLGTFTVKHYDAREGRHPRDASQVIQVKSKRLPRFRCGKALRLAVLETGPQ